MKLPSLLSKDSSNEGSPVDWVSAHLFFVKDVDLPEEVEDEELESFSELTLEDIAPFPIEQLAWGFYCEREASRLYIFAACKPRMPSKYVETWPEKAYVFSTFTLFIGTQFEQPTIVGLWQDKVVTAFYFDGVSRFPRSWAHHIIEEPEAPEEGTEPSAEYEQFNLGKEAFAGYAQLSQGLHAKFGATIEPSLIKIEKNRIGSDDSVTTDLTQQANPESESEPYQEVKLSDPNTIWSIDLRDNDYIEQAKKKKVVEHKLWKIIVAGGIAALLLLLLNVFNIVGAITTNIQDRKVATRLEETIKILDNEKYLFDLKQFTGKEFRPFDVLQALNDFRPDNIYFDYASANSNREIRIKGVAESVPQVNNYSNSLRESKDFSEVTLDNVRPIGNGSGVSFTLKLIFEPSVTEIIEEVVQNNSTP